LDLGQNREIWLKQFQIAGFLQFHETAVTPDDEKTRILQRLVGQRRLLVAEKVRLTNRITRALKDYYPQPMDWFDDIDTLLFCDFIKQWPNLNKVKRAHKATLIHFFHAHHTRSESKINKRLEAIKSSISLTEDSAVIDPSQNYVLCLTEMLRGRMR